MIFAKRADRYREGFMLEPLKHTVKFRNVFKTSVGLLFAFISSAAFASGDRCESLLVSRSQASSEKFVSVVPISENNLAAPLYILSAEGAEFKIYTEKDLIREQALHVFAILAIRLEEKYLNVPDKYPPVKFDKIDSHPLAQESWATRLTTISDSLFYSMAKDKDVESMFRIFKNKPLDPRAVMVAKLMLVDPSVSADLERFARIRVMGVYPDEGFDPEIDHSSDRKPTNLKELNQYRAFWLNSKRRLLMFKLSQVMPETKH